jgi:hypothetical protein
VNFSIVLASRERSQLLVGLMRSINETTHDLSKIEVLVGIDDDDAESHDAANHITGWYPWVHFFSRPRSNMLNRDYLNWTYDITGRKGRYVIACNDDCAFRTKDWDKIVLEQLDNYVVDKPDGIVYGYISDALLNRQGMNYCCFPLVSKQGVEALGWCMPPDFPAWTADIALWQLYSSVGRICDLSNVMIEHISYHSGKRDRDHISYHVQNISNARSIGMPFAEYHSRLAKAISNSVKQL